MRAYLIDPANARISEVDFNGDYRHIYELIDAERFDVARIDDSEGDGIYVDDEFLFKNHTLFYRVDGYAGGYLAGKGLVLGSDEQGESVEPRITLDDLKRRVIFVEKIGTTMIEQGVSSWSH